ncbi:hypothetical protein Q0590_03015 [Rhodocytophaga aerolata]|uniref:Uncharacterized protein n=1 Tax=Rhodocytophaga aerolata TaxID=455078 RepID=A0ABT8QZD3_9BACT|nr:hypothetical protein [Rhodocytophaga aerolata]MDO1445202.1 hypothetical protein [Rhodocytophaga aerolata]
MKRGLSIEKIRFSNKSILFSLATIVIVTIAGIYLQNYLLTYKEIPYNILIEDEKFYSKSEIIGWHTIDLGSFTIAAPTAYLYFKIRGIDSYVGGITNKRDTLIFDYGWYSNDLSDLDKDSSYQIKTITVNNKRFKIVEQKANSGFIGAYTNDLPKKNRLMIVCEDCEELGEKMKILQTIAFKQ